VNLAAEDCFIAQALQQLPVVQSSRDSPSHFIHNMPETSMPCSSGLGGVPEFALRTTAAASQAGSPRAIRFVAS